MSARPARRAGLVAAAVLLADQLSKALVRSSLGSGEQRTLVPGLTLVHTLNHGIAFGLSAGGTGVLVAIVALVLVAVVAFFYRHRSRPLVWLPTGLLIGGAVGNGLDRLRDGAVTDFIKLPLWPAFNLADAAITVGVLSLLYVLERRGA